MKEKQKINNNLKKIMLSILRYMFLAILLICIAYIVKWYIDSSKNQKLEEKISNSIIIENKENEEGNETKYTIDFNNLKSINSDVIAWLKVNGTKVEYPVVKTTNNSYYMNHNLEKEYSLSGWIFADYKNKFDKTDKNIVIYGHNMLDNAMFGSLEKILKEEWYNDKNNYVIDLITLNEHTKYEVFSIYKIENEDYYIKTEFNQNEFSEFINVLKRRSIKDFNVKIDENDSILTLSTCANNNNYRIVLHAKKMD